MTTHVPPRFLLATAVALLLLPALSCRLHAQFSSDSLDIERAIAAERSDLSYAGRARMLLLRRLRTDDVGEARRLLGFMDRYRPAGWLTATERLAAETLIGDSLLIRDTARMEGLLAAARVTERQHLSYHDDLQASLRDLLRGRADAVTARFLAWEPTVGERWFINLLINHLHVRGLRGQEELNSRVDEFARRFPDAPLLPIARQYIRKDYAEVDFGAAFSAGYSLGTFDGSLGEYFDSYHGPVLAGELYLYRITIAGSLNFGVADAVRDFEAGGERWENGESPFLNAALCAGYEFRFGRLAITPLAGLAMQSARGSDSAGIDEPDLPRTRDRVGLEVGALVGYRILPSDRGTHIDLRVRVGRTWTGLSTYAPEFSGALWYLQFAFALVQRPYDAR